ncbi:MAG TPA: hypothetical protein ENJ44_02055 [Oceanospirillales bacterium]|nr:hypothetical protein [Oceanospirillales bacterium]
MLKFLRISLFLIIVSQTGFPKNQAARYYSLANNRVYDVEIILFTYNNSLPVAENYSNKPIFQTDDAYFLEPKPTQLPFIKKSIDSSNNAEYTVKIDDKSSDIQVLAWFEHDKSFYKLNGIWEKLQKSNNITPLIHKAWRQPQTPFKKPEYVQIANYDGDLLPLPDLTVTGKVALSKGRFLHFGHKLNLFRTFVDSIGNPKNIIFALTERKQVKPNELHYFDSPWFGSIVKITKVTGE